MDLVIHFSNNFFFENKNEQPKLKCAFCPYTTVEHAVLNIHQRVHFNIRAYQCEVRVIFFL